MNALRFDAGSLSLDLVATVGRRYGEPVERLASVERLREWLRGVGLDVDGPLREDDLRRIRSLREDLHSLFRDVLGGGRPSSRVIGRVNAAAGMPRLRTTRTGLALERSGRPLDPVVALIAADAIRIVVGSERADLRVCDAGDCRMLYLARGRRARRWCSSERCGNRSRVATHRARAV